MKLYLLVIIIIILIIYIRHTRSKYLAYYTCFFGNDNSVANIIPDVPSLSYHCYFFSNNKKTLKRLPNSWIPVFVDIPIKNTPGENAMDSKLLKVCPHRFPELRGYRYTLYFDSKLFIDEESVLKNIEKMEYTNYLMLLNKHSFIKSSVWHEYSEAMTQERYRVDSEKYKEYIFKQQQRGLSVISDVHYETGAIIRKSSPLTEEIGELWYNHIQATGCECQISFFFVKQIYDGYIGPTNKKIYTKRLKNLVR